MLYIRVPSRTQGGHPQSALPKAGLPCPCWTGEESNYQIPERLGYSCAGSPCQSRVSSHSEHWCWPLPLGYKLISCSALFSWPVFVALILPQGADGRMSIGFGGAMGCVLRAWCFLQQDLSCSFLGRGTCRSWHSRGKQAQPITASSTSWQSWREDGKKAAL